MRYKKFQNTNNFFEIEKNKNNQRILFWGLDIRVKSTPLTKYLLNLIKKLNLPVNEVVEIYDDLTIDFFNRVYFSEK
jgi:hypothetical protein